MNLCLTDNLVNYLKTGKSPILKTCWISSSRPHNAGCILVGNCKVDLNCTILYMPGKVDFAVNVCFKVKRCFQLLPHFLLSYYFSVALFQHEIQMVI